MFKISGFYETKNTPNDTYTVQLEQFNDDDGWQAVDDIHFPRFGNQVDTPKGFPDDVNGAEAYAAKTWLVSHDTKTLAELAKNLKLSYNSLSKAAREGRLQAHQSGATWLSTVHSIKRAIRAGHLRPRKQKTINDIKFVRKGV